MKIYSSDSNLFTEGEEWLQYEKTKSLLIFFQEYNALFSLVI